VAVGDVFTVETARRRPGDDTVTLPALLLVDGDTVTSDAAAWPRSTVTGEIVEHGKGPKIRIHKFKNKTGYHKRQGHRQPLTQRRGHRHHEGLTPTWHTRRARRPPATAATPTPSASA
jgi:large subunit ribosomal protein L21